MSDHGGCPTCGTLMTDESGKCCRFVGIKMPDDLFEDLTAMTFLVQKGHPPKALSEVVKDCIRFRLVFLMAVRAGYATIRSKCPLREPEESGLTTGPVGGGG